MDRNTLAPELPDGEMVDLRRAAAEYRVTYNDLMRYWYPWRMPWRWGPGRGSILVSRAWLEQQFGAREG